MANVRLGSVVADIRGSIADLTYGRNRGGIFIRERVTPRYQRTAHQAAARDTLKDLSKYWSATLYTDERTKWRDYGARWPGPNKWGENTVTDGFLCFIRHNAHFYRLYGTVLWSAPPTGQPLNPPNTTITANATADTVRVALPPTNYPTMPDPLRLYAFAGKPVAFGRNSFTTPWRYAATNLYAAGSWTTYPWDISWPFPIDPHQALWIYLVAQNQDTGQISTRARARATT